MIKYGIKNLIDMVQHLQIDTSDIDNQIPDEKVIDFYVNRLSMCIGDNCPRAVNAYLDKLLEENCNSLTKSIILLKLKELQNV